MIDRGAALVGRGARWSCVAVLAASTACASPSGNAREAANGGSKTTISAAQLTPEEVEALRRQVMQCWNPPARPEGATSATVEIRVNANPDGTIEDARVVKVDGSPEPYVQAIADSAMRSIRNPRCLPLNAPADKYARWKTFTLVFHPLDLSARPPAGATLNLSRNDIERLRKALTIAPPDQSSGAATTPPNSRQPEAK